MWHEQLLEDAAGVPFAMAAVVIVVGLVRAPAAGRAGAAELVAAIGLALEFLLAAGLLRLSGIDDDVQLAIVGIIVLLRKVLTAGLRYGLQALGGGRPGRLRA